MGSIIGELFGRLRVISQVENDSSGKLRFQCACTCGKEIIVRKASLRSGHTRSCGCFKIDAATSHGMSHIPEYGTWCRVIQRCTDPNAAGYSYYGGRGIQVCSRWRGSFEIFFSDMGPRPSAEHSIERRDVNGHYEPSNCYWATPDVQANNKTNNVKRVIEGQTLTVAQISRKYGVPSDRIRTRLNRGMGIEEAVHAPPSNAGGNNKPPN